MFKSIFGGEPSTVDKKAEAYEKFELARKNYYTEFERLQQRVLNPKISEGKKGKLIFRSVDLAIRVIPQLEQNIIDSWRNHWMRT